MSTNVCTVNKIIIQHSIVLFVNLDYIFIYFFAGFYKIISWKVQSSKNRNFSSREAVEQMKQWFKQIKIRLFLLKFSFLYIFSSFPWRIILLGFYPFSLGMLQDLILFQLMFTTKSYIPDLVILGRWLPLRVLTQVSRMTSVNPITHDWEIDWKEQLPYNYAINIFKRTHSLYGHCTKAEKNMH